MSVALAKTDGQWTLRLSGVVTIVEAGALHAAATEAAREPRTVTVDCEGLEALDTCATQLLLALQSSLAAQGGALRLQNVPSPVADLWRRAGFHTRLR